MHDASVQRQEGSSIVRVYTNIGSLSQSIHNRRQKEQNEAQKQKSRKYMHAIHHSLSFTLVHDATSFQYAIDFFFFLNNSFSFYISSSYLFIGVPFHRFVYIFARVNVWRAQTYPIRFVRYRKILSRNRYRIKWITTITNHQ